MLLSLIITSCAQKTVTTTPSHPSLPASPNDSIVTAKIMRVQEGEGTIPWVLTIIIHTSQDLPGYPNITANQIRQQLLAERWRTPHLCNPVKSSPRTYVLKATNAVTSIISGIYIKTRISSSVLIHLFSN